MSQHGGSRPSSDDAPVPSSFSKDSISDIRLQLISLGLLRSTEAIAWTSIFPYVYSMIRSFEGVKEAQIPFYAGLFIAIFTFCEFLSGIVWARLSDRIGRKATLLIGPIFGMITAVTFGLSRSVVLATMSRALGGLFNPNVGLVPTCVMELATRSEQHANALSLVTFLRSMGNLLGPVLGGFLADPAVLYPSVFPPDSIWTEYPFLLPNLVVAAMQAISWIMAFLFLTETHPEMTGHSDVGLRFGQTLVGYLKRESMPQARHTYAPLSRNQTDADTLGPTDDCAAEEAVQELQDLSVIRQLPERHNDSISKTQPKKAFTLQVILQIVSVSLLAFHKVSSDALMPTFLAYSSIPSASQPTLRWDLLKTTSGFGYGSQKVGLILLSQALVALATQATLVPFFIDKVGSLRAYRIILGIYPAVYIFTPLLPKLIPPLPLVFVVFDLWIKVILSSIGYICSAILITKTAPASRFLARINGAAASFSCLSRSVGPIVTGNLFSVGVGVGYIGIPFWALSIVALFGLLESTVLTDHA